jgi:hypothetical protein
MATRFRVLVSMSIAVAAASIGEAQQEEEDVQKELRTYRSDVLGDSFSKYLESQREGDPEYDPLFSRLEEDDLRACLFDEARPSVAVRAAWEELLRTMPVPKDVNASTKADPAAADRFLGFVEGRLNIDLPERWESAVRSARRWENDSTSFSIPGRGLEGVPEGWHRLGQDGFWMHRRVESAKWGGENYESLTFRMAHDDASREVHLLDDVQRTWGLGRVNAIETATAIFVEAHGFDCQQFPLAAIDTNTATLKWKTTVWAARPMGHFGPPLGDHWTELVVRYGVLYTIGAGTDAVYIEGFQVDDGAPKFRFSSAY